MDERKIYKPVETIPSRASKEIRATSIAGHAATRGLFLPAHGADWVSDFVTEWGSFPLGRTDDMIDCCSLLGQLISRLAPGSAPVKKEEPKRLVIGGQSSLSLLELFEDNERHAKRGGGPERIR
jgi:hypothetical protein